MTARWTAQPRWCAGWPGTIHGAGCSPAPNRRPDGWVSRTPASSRAFSTDLTGAIRALEQRGFQPRVVFVDADVVLAPGAVAAAVELMHATGLDLVCPYPRQLTGSVGERVVQPLLQWSWLTFLPLRLAETSPRPSLAAANGQFLLVRREVYRRAGGHGAVRADVLEDIALLRAVKRVGGHGGVVEGSRLATCRMYDGWAELADGYAKSLWSAFGTPTGAVGAVGFLALLYVLPAVAALRGSRIGLAGYLAGVAGRMVAARCTGGRAWPDPLAHPLSVGAVGWLTVRSWRRRRAGTLVWKRRGL